MLSRWIPLLIASRLGQGKVTDDEWKASILFSGRQRYQIQKATFEFLLIANDVDLLADRVKLSNTIKNVDREYNQLMNGQSKKNIPKAKDAGDDVVATLKVLNGGWTTFKGKLEEYMELDTIGKSKIAEILLLSFEATVLADSVVGRYVDAAQSAGTDIGDPGIGDTDISGLQVNTASKQSMLAMQMCAKTALIGLESETSTSADELRATAKLFGEAHAGVLEGLTFVGLMPTVSKCQLQQMRKVSNRWNEILGMFDVILFEEEVDKATLKSLSNKVAPLVVDLETAAEYYANPPTDCPAEISTTEWANVIDESTRQLMYAAKAPRLFFQAALRVNVLDSRVLISNSLVAGRSTLKNLREGSIESQLPAPITQELSTMYGSMWSQWFSMNSFLGDNVETVSTDDTLLLADAAIQAEQFLADGLAALQMLSTECLAKATDINCKALEHVGYQRALIQKLSLEALMVSVGVETDKNKANLMTSLADFEQNHDAVIFGSGSDLSRTTDVCILEQMKRVYDSFIPYKEQILNVYQGDYSVDTHLMIWGMTWNAGVDPMFAVITDAYGQYVAGQAECSPSASREEYEVGIKGAGILRALSQKLAKLYFLVAKGVDTTSNSGKLTAAVEDFTNALMWITKGWTPEGYPSPPQQVVADNIFQAWDKWETLKNVLTKGTKAVSSVATNSEALLQQLEAVLAEYIEAVWNIDQSVPGSRSQKASGMLLLIEQMAKEAVLIALGQGSTDTLENFINEYESLQKQVKDGVEEGTQKDTFTGPSTPEELSRFAKAESAWSTFKPLMLKAAKGRSTLSDNDLESIGTNSETVENDLVPMVEILSSKTVTTTKVPVDILVPLPLTGDWIPGETMRLASSIAQDIINKQQLVLPGHDLKLTFIDSQCDADVAQREVLARFADSDAWVAVGGMACSNVCGSLAVISASLNMPAVAFDCTAESLSDTTLYPNFMRLGPTNALAKNVVAEWATMYGWSHIVILSGDPARYRRDATAWQAFFTSVDIGSTYLSSLESDWENTKIMMERVRTGRHRVVLYIGTDAFYRKVICASDAVGTFPGMTWISEGVRQKSFWSIADSEISMLHPQCTQKRMSELFAGALSITGLGASIGSESEQPLECFDGYSSQSLLTLIESHLQDGYTTDSGKLWDAVPNPYVELMGASADGICVVARAMKHMIDKGYDLKTQLRKPDKVVYDEIVAFMRETLTFRGVSGTVEFNGNDKPSRLGLWQVQDTNYVTVGMVAVDGTITTGYDAGLREMSWTAAPDVVVQEYPWAQRLQTVGRLRLLLRKCTFHFLMVACRIDVASNKQKLAEMISAFETEHDDLVNGPRAQEVGDLVILALTTLWQKWPEFKEFLERNKNKASFSLSDFNALHNLNNEIVPLAETCANMYADASNSAGSKVSGIQVNTASRQATLATELVVFVAKVALDFNIDQNLAKLGELSGLFSDAHAGLLQGLDFVGLQPTIDRCTLSQMRTVTYLWSAFEEKVQDVIYQRSADMTIVESMASQYVSLLPQIEAATSSYAEPLESCTEAFSELEWQNVIDYSSQQLMHAIKGSRLFLQAAKRVNTLDSRVLISNSLVTGGSLLGILREGSFEPLVPAPVTQEVSEAYGQLWSRWGSLSDMLADNVNTVSELDMTLMLRAVEQTNAFVTQTLQAFDSLVEECKASAAVPCKALQQLGLQRARIQKSHYHALQVSLGLNVQENKVQLLSVIEEFNNAQASLVFGAAPDISKASNVCIISQLKHVYDTFIPYEKMLMDVYNGDTTVETNLKIWGMTWNAGVDPFFAVISDTFQKYVADTKDCIPTGARKEYENAIKTSGILRALSQKMAKEYFLVVKGVDAADNAGKLALSVDQFSEMLRWLTQGWTPEEIPPPPRPDVLTSLWETTDVWEDYKHVLTTASSAVASVASESKRLLDMTQVLLTAYIDAVWNINMEAPGARAELVAKLYLLVQQMSKEAVMIALGQGSTAQLTTMITEFEDSKQLLNNGRTEGDQKDLFKGPSIPDEYSSMDRVDSSWNLFKPVVSKATAGRGSLSQSDLQEISRESTAMESDLLDAVGHLSTMTVTTTKIPIDILLPLPYTGSWTPGDTMQVASLVASDIINVAQVLLPGHHIQLKVMDSKCDADEAQKGVLQEFAISDGWVALGGMACSEVCASLSIIAASMYVPTVAFDCSAESLSNTDVYPDFMRLGATTTLAKDVVLKWANMFGWTHIDIVSGRPSKYRADAENWQAFLDTHGIKSTYFSAIESDWEMTMHNMERIKSSRTRVVFYLGTDEYYRKVICASDAVGTHPGMTWLSEGIRKKSFWSISDPKLLEIRAHCTPQNITQLFAGALSVTGLGRAVGEEADRPLGACFDGYTSKSLFEKALKHVQEGYSTSKLVVDDFDDMDPIPNPYVELIGNTLDGLCAIAMTVSKMFEMGYELDQLRTPTEVTYNAVIQYMRNELEFQGVVGTVKFNGNDIPNRLGLWQVQGSEYVQVGMVDLDGTITTSKELGLRDEYWQAAPEEVVVPYPWADRLQRAGRLRTLIMKATFDFMLVARGVEQASNKEKVEASISAFDIDYDDLTNGERAEEPGTEVMNALARLRQSWNPFKQFLLDNIDTASTDHAKIVPLSQHSADAVALAEITAERYAEAASGSGSGISGLQVNTVSRQNFLAVEMAYRVTLINVDFDRTSNVEKLGALVTLFGEAHAGLLEGLNFVGLTPTINRCILRKMRDVTESWSTYADILNKVTVSQMVEITTLTRIATQIGPFVEMISQATATYAEPPPECDNAILDVEWMNLLNVATEQVMYAIKGPRLFLQAAKRVNTLDSRVLISNSLISARSTLKEMREGFIAKLMPAPVTQLVSDIYAQMWGLWLPIEATLAEHVETVAATDTNLLGRVASQTELLMSESTSALEETVRVCQTRKPHFPCMALQYAGFQRARIQKASYEALMLSLGMDMDKSKANLLSTLGNFTAAHHDLIFGVGSSINRTTSVCIISQMKHVYDHFLPYESLLMRVYQGDHSIDLNLQIWGLTWNAGVDPLFAVITEAFSQYANGKDDCIPTAARKEYEVGMKTAGILRALSQKIAKEYFLISKGVSASDNNQKLSATIERFSQLLSWLTQGWTPEELPAPPRQDVVDQIWILTDTWAAFKNILATTSNAIIDVEAQSLAVLAQTENVLGVYVDAVWNIDTDAPGSRSNLVSSLYLLTEQLAKEAVLISLGQGSTDRLVDLITQFEDSKQFLRTGRKDGDLKDLFDGAETPEQIIAMNRVDTSWNEFKPLVNKAIAGRMALSQSDLQDISRESEDMESALLEAVGYLSTKTVTTTKVPIDILLPLPYTGAITPGDTLQVASLVASDIINVQQRVLPGYHLQVKTMDSKCDADTAQKGVLAEFARSDGWVALGGMACPEVCASLSIIAASVYMPTVAFGCSEDFLSNTAQYPEFMRLGTPTTLTKDVVAKWANMFGWSHIAIVSGRPSKYSDDAEKMQAFLDAQGIKSTYFSAIESDWEMTKSNMERIRSARHRVVFYIGTDDYYRKVICASDAVGMHPGMTWLSEGIRRKAFWSMNDPDLLAIRAQCTPQNITRLFAGALSVTGLGKPHGEEAGQSMPCFEGYTPQSLYDAIQTGVREGYSTSDYVIDDFEDMPPVPNPYIELAANAADGMCMIALTMKHMMEKYSLEQLRTPSESIYQEVVEYMRNVVEFKGVLGTVKFNGNDVPNRLGLWQVQGSEYVQVGLVDLDGTITTGEESGLRHEYWQAAPEEVVVPYPWAQRLQTAGRQRFLIRKVALRLFMIAKGFNVNGNRKQLADTIAAFETEHADLVNGPRAEEAGADVFAALAALQERWPQFKKFLEEQSNAASFPLATLTSLSEQTDELVILADVVALRYVDAANGAGSEVNALQVNTVSKQSTLLMEMGTTVALINNGIDKAKMLQRVGATSKLFGDAHSGLSEGLDFVGLQATINKCILKQMRVVTNMWTDLSDAIGAVTYLQRADNSALKDIESQINKLVPEVEAATAEYAEPPLTCAMEISALEWENALNTATEQIMQGTKGPRLFLQAAKRVNTLDSRVLISSSLVAGRTLLKYLREGSMQRKIPSPPIQEVSDTYGQMWGEWLVLDALMASNVDTVAARDKELLSRAEDKSKAFLSLAMDGLETLVAECQIQMPHFPCMALQFIGYQRARIQMLSFQALLVSLGLNIRENKEILLQAVDNFTVYHDALIFGYEPHINKTTDVCILYQMKAVYDSYLPYQRKILDVHEGDYSIETNLEIWSMTWNAGVDPFYAVITEAFNQYAKGSATCTPTSSREEYEVGIKTVGLLRSLTQKATSEYLFVVKKGLENQVDATTQEKLTATLAQYMQHLRRLISGYTPDKLPSPPLQAVVDSLWAVFDMSMQFSRSLSTSAYAVDIAEVAAESLSMLGQTETAMTTYIDAVWDINTDVPGSRSALVTSLPLLIQQMVKEAVLILLGYGSASELDTLITQFDTSQTLLKDGYKKVDETGSNESTVKQKEDIDAAFTPEELLHFDRVEGAWSRFKPLVTKFVKKINEEKTPSDGELQKIMSESDAIEPDLQGAVDVLSTMTMTTTKIPVDVLVPLPFNGTWTPGETLKLSAMIARDIINQQQLLLPGHDIKLKFMDSKCDADFALRGVLAQFASSDDWVALSGLACSQVCSSLAVISSSMWIPSVAFDCTADYLSKTDLYPDFLRLGTKTTPAKDVIKRWASMFGWGHIAIVSGDPATYREEASQWQEEFSQAGLSSTTFSAIENQNEAARSTMQEIKDSKHRVVFFIGDDEHFRRIVCASDVVGTLEGMTWISEGTRKKNFWKIDDINLQRAWPQCTPARMTQLFDGALSITGLGSAVGDENKESLSCFDGYTSKSLLAHIEKHLDEGYTALDGEEVPAVPFPHSQLMGAAADAICVIARAVKYMIEQNYDLKTELRKPQKAVYDEIVRYMRTETDFNGTVGKIKFDGNDNPGRLGLWQVQGDSYAQVGSVEMDGTIMTGAEQGLQNQTWQPAPSDPEDPPFPWKYVYIPGMCALVCLPCCAGWYFARREERVGQSYFSQIFAGLQAARDARADVRREMSQSNNRDRHSGQNGVMSKMWGGNGGKSSDGADDMRKIKPLTPVEI